MGTKNISLPQELEAYIDAKVASGEYAHASEVVRDAIRLLMRQEAEKLKWLRTEIAKGEADIAASRILTSQQVTDRLAKDREAWLADRNKSSR
jgi:putative addiction module CopG family antidote